MKQTNHLGLLLRLNVKRDLKYSVIWLAVIMFMMISGLIKLTDVYGDTNSIQQLVSMMSTPIMTTMFGKVPEINHYNTAILFGAIMIPMMGVLMGMMNIQIAGNGARREEAEGVTELIRATSVKTETPLLLVMVELLVLNIVTTLLIYGSLLILPMQGANAGTSLLLAGILVMIGLFFGSVTLVIAQLFADARTVSMVSFAILGLSYVLRMVIDARGLYDFVWLSPFNWLESTQVYFGNHLRYMTLPLILIVGFSILAVILVQRRDLNAGIIQTADQGRARAGITLRGFVSVLSRLELKGVIGWQLGIAFMAMIYGSLFNEVADMVASNQNLVKVLGLQKVQGMQDELFTRYMVMISLLLALLAIMAGFSVIQRQHKDAQIGVFDLLGSQPISRTKYFLTYTVGGQLVGIISWIIGYLVLWVTASLTVERKLPIDLFMTAFWGYLPMILLSLAIGAVFIGWLPRWFYGLYIYFGVMFLLTYMKHLLELPDWFLRLSPFGWTEDIPAMSVSQVTLWGMVIIGAILMAIGWFGFRRRDLV